MKLIDTHINSFFILLLLSLGLLLVFGYNGKAVADEMFTNASLKGAYGVVSIGRGGQVPQASIGIVTFNGNGDFEGTIKENLPGAFFGERKVEEVELKGYYVVDNNGTGTATTNDGSEFIFVVTKVNNNSSGLKKAQKVTLIEKDLNSQTGNFISFTLTKLPDKGTFDQASLNGVYSLTIEGHGGLSPARALGVLHFDGKGNFSGLFNVNLQGSSFTERVIVPFPFEGTYTVNPDGTGTLINPDGSETILVITKASNKNVLNEGNEFFYIASEPGIILTTVGIKQP
ncbi:MAG TPA: hypothetical protein VJL89_10650 [Thermodesulfovibrionia bacterium]|nr:hypothetical protein [Thermodesulfovibrionia bacterium]